MRTSLVTPLVLALLAGPVAAQDMSATDKRIADLEKKVEELSKKAKDKEKADSAASAKTEKAKGTALRSYTDKGQLAWESADGAYKFRLTGRVQFDGLFNSGSENRLSNGVTLRRVRLGYKAVVAKDWTSELSVDFAENAVDIKDAFIGYQGFEDMTIQAGHFKVPFGFDTLTSSKDIWFVERSYTDAVTPDRRLGLGYFYGCERYFAAADFYGQTISADATGVDQGWGWAARLGGTPVYSSETKAVHLGAAVAWRKPDANADSAKPYNILYSTDFSARPEATKVSKAKFLNSGTMNNVDWTKQYDVELAGVWQGISWQGEYQWTQVTRMSGNPTLSNHNFTAWYLQASYMFGGKRRYSGSEGLFKGVTPTAKMGAFELAARYSTMDLNDITDVDPIKGGSAKNFTFGANWYPNSFVRLMLNYTRVNNDDYAKPKALYGGIVGVKFDEYQFRVQFAF